MGVKSRTIIYTVYHITCDYCGREDHIDTSHFCRVYNKRDAVRSLGWICQRNDRVMCYKCFNIKRLK